jgi:predicted DNA-binding transcriptional regulator AlpA
MTSSRHKHSPARWQRHERPAPSRLALTVDEFCSAHGISRTHLYDLWREGRGPRFMRAGDKRRLISVEAAADWRLAIEHQPSKRGGK